MKNIVTRSMKTLVVFPFVIIALVLLLVLGLFVSSSSDIQAAQLQVTALTNDNMILQKAVSDHLQWADKLNSTIHYGAEFTGGTDPKLCEFGKIFYSGEVQNDPNWAGVIGEVEPYHNQIHAHAKEVLAANPEQAERLYVEYIRSDLNALIAKLNDQIAVQQGKVREAEVQATRSIQLEQLLMVIQAVILLGLLVNMYFFIRREVIRPILHIKQQCGHLAQGKLALDFTVKCENADIQQLGESMNNAVADIKMYIDNIDQVMQELSKRNFDVASNQPFIGDFQSIETSIGRMVDDVSEAFSQMDTAVVEVSSGADQVANGAQVLAQGATEQGSSVQELNATVSEISNQIKLNAENSKKAGEMASGATAAISASNEQMQRLMVSMRDIDSKSKEISKIIKDIEDIAFQTNILALNAAVEAARAGAAGKGFAVVANEVRNLAAKSAEAAQNTTTLIESSISAISNGVNLAQTTADELGTAVEGAKETTKVILEIGQATTEQARAITEITAGLDEISSVVHVNAATSEESAAASEELSSQAGLLRQLIGSFRISTQASFQ